MIEIILTVIVIWLLGSAIYSTQFHLINYFRGKNREDIRELNGVVQKLSSEMRAGFIRRVLWIQIVKVLVASSIIYILVFGYPYDKVATNNNGIQDRTKWTEGIKARFLQGCIEGVPIPGMTNENIQNYCSCVLEKTMYAYPEPEDINDRLPWNFIIDTGVECAEAIKTSDAIGNDNFNSDKVRFLFSVLAFEKAFELEPFVDTDIQQREYEALIKTGVDLGSDVNDDFLNNLHPELLSRYRNNLIQGGKDLLDGNAIDDNLSLSLQKLTDGAELVNKFGSWWNVNVMRLTEKLQ